MMMCVSMGDGHWQDRQLQRPVPVVAAVSHSAGSSSLDADRVCIGCLHTSCTQLPASCHGPALFLAVFPRSGQALLWGLERQAPAGRAGEQHPARQTAWQAAAWPAGRCPAAVHTPVSKGTCRSTSKSQTQHALLGALNLVCYTCVGSVLRCRCQLTHMPSMPAGEAQRWHIRGAVQHASMQTARPSHLPAM